MPDAPLVAGRPRRASARARPAPRRRLRRPVRRAPLHLLAGARRPPCGAGAERAWRPAPRCAWWRATRPTSRTWTGSPRATSSASRTRFPRPCGSSTTAAASPSRARRRRSAGDRDASAGGSRRSQGRAAARVRRARPRRGRRGHAGVGLLQRGRAARSRWPTPTGCWRRTTGRACGSGRRWWRAARTASSRASSRSPVMPDSSSSTAIPAAVADEAARRALTMLDARPAPAGPMPVVVGNGFGGVLFHEATGHGLESDAVQKHASVYEGRIGDKLAAVDRDRLRRRHHAARVGDRRDRRRGHALSGDARDRRGPAVRLPVRPSARPAGGPRFDRATAAARASATCRSRA